MSRMFRVSVTSIMGIEVDMRRERRDEIFVCVCVNAFMVVFGGDRTQNRI